MYPAAQLHNLSRLPQLCLLLQTTLLCTPGHLYCNALVERNINSTPDQEHIFRLQHSP